MTEHGGVRPSRLFLFASIALTGLAFDLVTKSMVFARIGPPPSPPVPIIDHVLELRTSHNTGALWGWGANFPFSSLIFAGLSFIAALIIFYWLFFLGAASSRMLTVGLGLIMAGAMGNCYDRLVYGYVRDFVHFHVDELGVNWAIFNFADNMLVAGAITLALYEAIRFFSASRATSSDAEPGSSTPGHLHERCTLVAPSPEGASPPAGAQ